MALTLWTLQHRDAWEELERTGVLRADPDRVWEDFRGAYDWMADQMRARIGPPPKGVRYPIWAWYQWEGQRRPMDLRRSGYAPRGTPMVRIEFEIDAAQVLLSEFDRWNIVLGGGVPERFEGDPAPSREHIFAPDRWTPGWDAPPGEQSIQAVLWELRKEQIRRVRHFTAK